MTSVTVQSLGCSKSNQIISVIESNLIVFSCESPITGADGVDRRMIVGTRSVRRYFSSVIRRLARWSRQSMLSCHCDCSCREHWLHHRSTLRLRRPSPTSSCLRCVHVTHTTLLTVTYEFMSQVRSYYTHDTADRQLRVHVSGAFRYRWSRRPEFMSQVHSCYTHDTADRHLSSCLRCIHVTHTRLLTVTWVHVSGAFMLHTRDCWLSPTSSCLRCVHVTHTRLLTVTYEFMSQVCSCYTHEASR